MKILRMTLAAAFLAWAAPAVAQSDVAQATPLPAPTSPLVAATLVTAPDLRDVTDEQRVALQRWMEAYAEWTAWSAQWAGRRQRGWFTSYRDRQDRPAPPSWLPARCGAVFDDRDPLFEACTLLAEWRGDQPQTRLLAATPAEENRRVVWWEHVHLDLLWPALQGEASIYGVVGTHATATVKGRWQVFLAPGVMFVNMPARNGGRVWKLAANYGVGYRLAEFTFPGRRQAALHVNLAKAWLVSDVSDVVGNRSVDFIGFSITFTR